MDNLNQFLQPINAPVGNSSGQVSSYDFATGYDRSAITLSKIRNFSFNSGTGGTLTLGGPGNGNGYFVIKDASGSTIVTGDNNGITVTGGSVTIKNSAGTTILDSTGLVSANNFDNNFYYDDASIHTTSGSYVDVTGSSLNVVLSRSTNVMVAFYGLISTYGTAASTSYRSDLAVAINGTVQSPAASSGWYSTTALTFIKTDSVSCARIFTMAAGTNTIKLQWRTNNATDGADLLTRNLNYMVLGS